MYLSLRVSLRYICGGGGWGWGGRYASVLLGSRRHCQVGTFMHTTLHTSVHTREKNIDREVPEAVAAHMASPCSPLSARRNKLGFTQYVFIRVLELLSGVSVCVEGVNTQTESTFGWGSCVFRLNFHLVFTDSPVGVSVASPPLGVVPGSPESAVCLTVPLSDAVHWNPGSTGIVLFETDLLEASRYQQLLEKEFLLRDEQLFETKLCHWPSQNFD